MSYIFIAQAYTGVEEEAFEHAKTAIKFYAERSTPIYVPIAMFHQAAIDLDMPGDKDYWKHQNRAMLRHAAGLHILNDEHWPHSKGVAVEIALARHLGIQVMLATLFPDGSGSFRALS